MFKTESSSRFVRLKIRILNIVSNIRASYFEFKQLYNYFCLIFSFKSRKRALFDDPPLDFFDFVAIFKPFAAGSDDEPFFAVFRPNHGVVAVERFFDDLFGF